ncbi:hypothetical protein [Bacillus toyonensis]|uniref:hypothetical protein n=1 Tax=Bacillus toyonensis TaxID=155322 RepID=UPI002E1C626C|nr:hypothetical protein [Bacillus toyonensis]
MENQLIVKLNHLEKVVQELRDTIDEIKVEAKSTALNQVQKKLMNGESDAAKQIIDSIDDLNNLRLNVNSDEIHSFVLEMLNMSPTQKRMSNLEYGVQFKEQKKVEIEDVKSVMNKKGYRFVEHIEKNLKFEKDGEFYFAIEVNKTNLDEEFERSLSDSSKYCNLVLITESEYIKEKVKQRVETWMENKEDKDVLKKYLTIQLGSYEHLNQKGTVLERMQLA